MILFDEQTTMRREYRQHTHTHTHEQPSHEWCRSYLLKHSTNNIMKPRTLSTYSGIRFRWKCKWNGNYYENNYLDVCDFPKIKHTRTHTRTTPVMSLLMPVNSRIEKLFAQFWRPTLRFRYLVVSTTTWMYGTWHCFPSAQRFVHKLFDKLQFLGFSLLHNN